MSLTVACVLRSGGIYTPEWVEALQRGVAAHLSLDHEFVCLSDVAVPVKRIPLLHDWPRWWSKIELFRPGIFPGQVLYFDLDTVIVGSLDRIASHQHTFTMAHEFNRPRQKCSTAMAWDGTRDFGIYREFGKNPSVARLYNKVHRIGDQAFIEEHLAKWGVYPDTFSYLFGERSVASYKVHKCANAPPRDAAAVAFHGKPKPHEIASGWVKELWGQQ